MRSDAQSDAALLYRFRRNLVLVASAGTGKTHCLVGVAVHLLLGASELTEGVDAPVLPSRIAATTFSRKAAAEIRGRIIEELERLVSADNGATYRRELDLARERVGLTRWSDRELANRARTALDSFNRAQIGTLHSFAASISKAHALELGLPLGFEVADEEDTRVITYDAIGKALSEYEADDIACISDLVRMAGSTESLVGEIAKVLERLEEDGSTVIQLVVGEGDRAAIEAEMGALIGHAKALTDDPKCCSLASAFLTACNDRDLEGARESLRLLFKVRGAPKTPAAEAFFDFRDRALVQKRPDAAGQLLGLWHARDIVSSRATSIQALFGRCERAVKKARLEACALSFGDVLRAARDILRDDPASAAQLSQGFDALLVDEFQDSSRVQLELVQLIWQRNPKMRRAGDMPTFSDLRPSGLLVVGDRKQSIYGFRGANVSLFAEFCVGLAGAPAREALGIPQGRLWEPKEPAADFLALRHNRRSKEELLTFANAFSKVRFQVESPELYDISYISETEDLLPPPERESSSQRSPRAWWLRVPVRGQTSSPVEEALVIADTARRLWKKGEPLVRDRPPTWRDMAVLAPTNNMLDVTAYALAQAGIPYVVAGTGFFSAREVRDMIAMLAILLRRNDKLALLEVLRGPWAGVHDQTLVALTDDHRGIAELGPSWETGERRDLVHPDDRETLSLLRRVVERLRRNVDRFAPEVVLREAVHALGLEEVLIQLPRGPQRVANVRKFLEFAASFGSTRVFFQWVRTTRLSGTSETEAAIFSDEDDAIRLLTIHASKGLDFPIVFIPRVGTTGRKHHRQLFFLDVATQNAPTLSTRIYDAEGILQDPPSFRRAREIDSNRQRAEAYRHAYVATTRASEAMFFIGDRKPPKDTTSDTYQLTTASVLSALAATEASAQGAQLEVETLLSVPVFEALDGTAGKVPSISNLERPIATWHKLSIGTTALQDFYHCSRRYQLAHLFGFPEPSVTFSSSRTTRKTEEREVLQLRSEARAEGVLVHRVLERISASAFGSVETEHDIAACLEREGISPIHRLYRRVAARAGQFLRGSYAQRIVAHGASILREHPFLFELIDDRGRALIIRGTIDSIVRWPDGSLDVLDYKSARGPDVTPFELQLSVYGVAAKSSFLNAPTVRTGILFLGRNATEPRFFPAYDEAQLRSKLIRIGATLWDARYHDRFFRVAVEKCHKIHCGYIEYCHPRPDQKQLRLPLVS